MSPHETTILWDFDNTLFQTKAFWRAKLFPAYEPMGITSETVEEAFKEATSVVHDYFVPDAILSALQKRTDRGALELTPTLERIVYTELGRSFFFPHALETVLSAKQKGYAHYLLSYGDNAFKQKWFASLGLLEYFSSEEILITNKKKPLVLGHLTLRNSVIVVNDVLTETREVLDALTLRGHTSVAYQFTVEPSVLEEKTYDGVNYFTDFLTLRDTL